MAFGTQNALRNFEKQALASCVFPVEMWPLSFRLRFPWFAHAAGSWETKPFMQIGRSEIRPGPVIVLFLIQESFLPIVSLRTSIPRATYLRWERGCNLTSHQTVHSSNSMLLHSTLIHAQLIIRYEENIDQRSKPSLDFGLGVGWGVLYTIHAN